MYKYERMVLADRCAEYAGEPERHEIYKSTLAGDEDEENGQYSIKSTPYIQKRSSSKEA